jgi:protein TonB
MKFPDDFSSPIKGTIVIKFVVEANGKVTDVQADSGPKELFEVSIDLIKHSPKWVPAVLNGINVKSYKTPPLYYVRDY